MKKGRVIYGIFLFFMLFLFLFLHEYYSLAFFLTFLILPVVSYGITRYIYKKISLNLEIHQASVWAKHKADVTFQINNPTIFSLARVELHFNLVNEYYENDIEQTITLAAMAKKNRWYDWGISSDYCGKMTIRMISMVFYDPLNLFSFTRELALSQSIMVMPLVSQVVMDIFAKDAGIGQEENPSVIRGEDVSEVLDVRPYIPGDKESRIHWKLSLKEEEWMVKVYPYLLSKEIVLLVDLYQSQQEVGLFDDLMTAFYSTALELIRQDMVFSVCYYQKNTGELFTCKVTSKEDLFIALESLFLSKPYSKNFFSYEQYCNENRQKQNTTIYFSDVIFCQSHNIEPLFTFQDKVVVSCL